MQITNGFWLDENTQKTPRTNQIRAVLRTKFKKMAMVFSRRRRDLILYAKVKKIFQKPQHSKKYLFLAKCIENAVLREKYYQQNRGKWAKGTKKQATYNRLR